MVKLEERNGVTGKECSKCGEWKTLEDYSKDKRSLSGKKSRCRECLKQYKRENKEHIAEQGKQYKQENREQITKQAEQWRQENKEKIAEQTKKYRQENKEYFTKYRKQYQKENPEKLSVHRQNRRARVKALPYTWTEEQAIEVIEHFGGCFLTGEQENIHIDHVVPLATGHGGTMKENMLPLRADLNISKKDKNVFEWFKQTDLPQDKFDYGMKYIADLNGMTLEQYKQYVYECH